MNRPLPGDSDTIDLADVARNVKRGWPLIIGITLLGAAAAAAILIFVPPRFSGSTSVVVRASESSSSSLSAKLGGSLAGAAAGLLPGGLGTTTPIETEQQILSSRSIAGEVVDSLLLQFRMRSARRDPPSVVFQAASFPGSFKKRELHFQQSAGGKYMVSGLGSPVELAPGVPTKVGAGSLTLGDAPLPPQFSADLYDREEAITRLEKRLGVSKPGGEVVAVSYEGDDSVSAAQVPNLIVADYMVRRRTTDRGVNARKVDFLSGQVDSVEQTLRNTEDAYKRQQQASGDVDPVVVGKLELAQAGDLRKEAGDLDVERGALEQLLSQVNNGTLTATQVAAFPTFLKSPAINELLSQLSTLQTKRLQLLATYTPQDPSVIAATNGIKNIQEQLPALAKSYAQSLDRQRADVALQLDTLQAAIAQLPATGEASARFQRQILSLGEVSAALEAQLVEAKLATIGEGGDVRVLDVAEPPLKASFPQPGWTFAGGIGGGLLIGLIAAIFAGSYGRYVPDARAIERQLGIRALTLDPAIPFLVAGASDLRTILLVPLDSGVDTAGVGERLMRTAVSRGLRGTVLDLSKESVSSAALVPDIDRLSNEFDLVAVRLPEITSDRTLGVLSESRPVLFVASAGRVDRHRLSAAVEGLERLSIPCAGVVLSRQNGKSLLRA